MSRIQNLGHVQKQVGIRIIIRFQNRDVFVHQEYIHRRTIVPEQTVHASSEISAYNFQQY